MHVHQLCWHTPLAEGANAGMRGVQANADSGAAETDEDVGKFWGIGFGGGGGKFW